MKATRKVKRAARRLFRLCTVEGTLQDDRARLVARRLAASTRRGRLALLTAFGRLVRLHSNRRRALVESAAPLDDDLRARLGAGLARRHGAGLHTTFEQNASLIGGMRITVGSDVYDGSVRGRLAALDAELQRVN